MIIDKKVEISINPRNKKYYEEKGYEINFSKKIINTTKIEVSIEDLFSGSTIKLTVECDNCCAQKPMEYRHYLNNKKKYDKYYCNKCKHIKSKLTKKERYGDENYNNKEQNKLTMLEKYGVEHPFQNKEIFNKMLETKKAKYNDKNYNNREQSKSTKKERYGDEHYNNKTKLKIKSDIKSFENIKNLIKINNKTFEISCSCCDSIFSITKEIYRDRKHHKRTICTICNPLNNHVSDKENELFNFIAEIYDGEIYKSNRTEIKPYELDIYLPELNIAFEFNGLYWHSELYKDRDYHKMKLDICKEKNINLFHVYEDSWNHKKDIIKSMIKNKIKNSENILDIDKTTIKIIENNKIVDNFYIKNHLQGKTSYSINIGLFYENEIVSLMSFKKQKDSVFELVRFCDKLNLNINNSELKLLNYFTKNNDYSKIISFSNNDFQYDNLYEILNFKQDSELLSDYSYIIDNIRKDKKELNKTNLKKMCFDIENKTEHEICLENNIFRIYDSGKTKWIYEKKLITKHI